MEYLLLGFAGAAALLAGANLFARWKTGLGLILMVLGAVAIYSALVAAGVTAAK